MNSKVLGLGPDFIIKLNIDNKGDEPLYNINILPLYDKKSLTLTKMVRIIDMLAPNITYNIDIRVKSLSLKNETIDFEMVYGATSYRTTVHLPNCE